MKRIITCLLAIAAMAWLNGTAAAEEGERRQTDDARLAERLALGKGSTPFTRAPTGSAIPDGLGWLDVNQNPSGSFGSAFEFVDTATVTDVLGRAQPLGTPFADGVNWLTGNVAGDNEELARKVLALEQVEGLEIEALVDALLAERNAAVTDQLAPNYPEGGWGLQSGFETDALTTALALHALESAGRKAGIGVVDEALAPAGTNVHAWEIASDATRATIRISVGGADVRLRMTEGAPPTGAEAFFTLPAGGTFNVVFPDSGIPFTSGTNYIAIESTGPAATYTFTASYETAEFNTLAFAEALDYLRRAQNVDGGWGIQIGDSTTLYTTVHVLQAIQRYRDYDFDAELTDGINYLLGEQAMDGSFGVSGTPIPYLTALAALNLVRYEVCPFSVATEDAIGALLAQRQMDGSWANESYDTGLAVRALWEYDNDGDGVFQDGDCSGTVGDNVCMGGMTTGCDDNCVAYDNATQGSVVFGEQIVAPGKNSLAWSRPVDIAFIKGDIAAVSSYGVTEGGALPFATSLSTFGDQPVPGGGLYYLLRRAGDCMTTSWQSGLGAEPGRDTASLGEVDTRITSPADGAVISASPVVVSGTVAGSDPITVTVNAVAAPVSLGTFSASVPLTRGVNTITAMATDAAGFMGSDQISVTKVDYSLAISGSVVDLRLFTGDSATLDQIAFFTETQIGVPPGLVYTTLGVARISATQMQVDFQIDVTGGATPGIYFFQVEYGLLDAGMNPLGPLTGNVFDFQVEVTP